MEQAKIFNLTGTEVTVIGMDGKSVLLKPESWKAHCEVSREKVFDLGQIEVCRNLKGEIRGVPEKNKNTFYLVSRIVADALKEQQGRVGDILVPDEVIRKGGRIVSCKSLAMV